MRKILCALLLSLTLTASVAQAADMNLTGEWKGKYFYPEDKSPPVEFTLKLAQAERKFTGTSTEPQTFGPKKVGHLNATIDGKLLDGRRFTFTKQMDGSGGVTHAIQYMGELSPNGESAAGTWTVPGSWSGKFEMTRQ